MSPQTHQQLANFIWSICNLLRGPYKRNEYRKVILPLTVLKRFDCVSLPTKTEGAQRSGDQGKSDNVVRPPSSRASPGCPSTIPARSLFQNCLTTPTARAASVVGYINGFSPNVRDIFEKFKFGEQVAFMAEKDLLYAVVKSLQ
jgi:type I restriction enzyme M protein